MTQAASRRRPQADRRRRPDRAGVRRVHRTVRRLQAAGAQPARRRRSPRPCSSRGSAGTSRPRRGRQRVPLGPDPGLRAADRVVFSWDIGPDWQLEADPDNASEVEVRFVAETPDRTRVELEHRNIDRHGPGWEAVRDGVDDDAGLAAVPGPVRRPVHRGPLTCRRSSPPPTSTGRPTTCSPTPPTRPGSTNGRRASSAATWTAGTPGVGARCVTVRRIGGAERPSTSELVRSTRRGRGRVRGLDGPIRAASTSPSNRSARPGRR